MLPPDSASASNKEILERYPLPIAQEKRLASQVLVIGGSAGLQPALLRGDRGQQLL